MKAITFNGKPLKTQVSGSIHSSGGLVHTAYNGNETICHRQNGDRGIKGFFKINLSLSNQEVKMTIAERSQYSLV